MDDPWSETRFPPYRRRSRTALGEIGDDTRRKNSVEVNRLGTKLRLMGREMQVVNNELRHQQTMLEVKVTNSVVPARRGSLTAADARELLIKQEQDKFQTINQKCKDFIHSSINGQENISHISIECPSVDSISAAETSPTQEKINQSEPEKSSSGYGGDSESSSDLDAPSPHRKTRERRVGVVHNVNMDVQLDLDSGIEHEPPGYHFRTRDQKNKSRGNLGGKWDTLSKPKHPVRSKRDLEVKFQEEMMKLEAEEESRGQNGRRRSLPFIMGRRITQHDRKNSKSRDNLLLPNVSARNPVSPEVKIRIKYANDDENEMKRLSPDIPFSKKHSPRIQSKRPHGRSESVSPRMTGPRLEIDLSLPTATSVSRQTP